MFQCPQLKTPIACWLGLLVKIAMLVMLGVNWVNIYEWPGNLTIENHKHVENIGNVDHVINTPAHEI